MKNLLLLLFGTFVMSAQEVKTSKIVNPNEKWYFGIELGQNTITSYTFGENASSIHAGILAEFYTGRHWSLTGRIKYFKTGLSYYYPGTSSSSGFFNFGGTSSKLILFEGAVITMPINIKWEFRIWKNFSGNLNFGINYNIETESNFYSSSPYDYSNYSDKEYFSANAGYGFNYFIDNKSAIFLNIESYSGAARGQSGGWLFPSEILNTNTLINLGYKRNFKFKS